MTTLTTEEIIELARQAGCVEDKHYKGEVIFISKDVLEAFAKLVAEAEREACAKVFDELAEKATNARDLVYLSQTAAIIRSRLGDEK